MMYFKDLFCTPDEHLGQGFFWLFWEDGPCRLNWDFRGVLLKIGNF